MMVWVALGVVVLLYVVIEQIYAHFWDAKLEVNAYLPTENVHEGETACVTEVIVNDKFLPLPILETFFPLDKGLRYVSHGNASVSDKQYRRDTFAVGMKRKIKRTFEITCVKRGYYTLAQIEMMSSDLFLQQKLLAKRDVNSAFHVYPRRVRSDELELPYRRIMGELMVQKKLLGDPFSFGGMRDYVNSDPMSTINWNASAKAQNLIVNVYDSSIDQKVLVLLDTYENTESYSENLNEESICIAAALTERLFRQGVEVTLLGNAQDVCTQERLSMQAFKGQGVAMMKERLARVQLGAETPITALFHEIPDDMFVVLVSKNQDLQMQLKAQLQDFFWIMPYRGTAPDMPSLGGQVYMWQYKSGNMGR